MVVERGVLCCVVNKPNHSKRNINLKFKTYLNTTASILLYTYIYKEEREDVG